MTPCRYCGTDLPEDAKFCLQCGTPVPQPESDQPPPPPPPPPPALTFLEPALAGGMFLGLLSSMPLVNLGNCLCCMWILGGGAITTFLLTKQRPDGITYGDGAYGGVMAGFFGAIVATLVSIPIRILSAGFLESQQVALEGYLRDLPQGPFKDMMMRVASPEVTAFTVTFTFVTNLIFFSLFAMIGGILMVAILQKRRMGN